MGPQRDFLPPKSTPFGTPFLRSEGEIQKSLWETRPNDLRLETATTYAHVAFVDIWHRVGARDFTSSSFITTRLVLFFKISTGFCQAVLISVIYIDHFFRQLDLPWPGPLSCFHPCQNTRTMVARVSFSWFGILSSKDIWFRFFLLHDDCVSALSIKKKHRK